MNSMRNAFRLAGFLLGLLTIIAATVTADVAEQPLLKTTVNCATQTVKITTNYLPNTQDVYLKVVFAEYRGDDPDCGNMPEVQIKQRLELDIIPGEENSRTLTFDELGLVALPNCDVYIVTARARARLDSPPFISIISEDSCESPAARQALQIVPLENVEDQIRNDLVCISKIDLNAIRPPGSEFGSCLKAVEYAGQATNTSADKAYTLTIDAKYICTANAAVPNHCEEDNGDSVHGPGWNRSVQTDLAVVPGECSGPVGYMNFDGGAQLPSCCDRSRAALQCADFVVTGFASQQGEFAIMPASIFETSSSDYQNNPVTYSCEDFFPSPAFSFEEPFCFGDTDLDGALGDELDSNPCDNCVSVYNPDQADADGDRHGDLCDNCPDVYNPNQLDLDLDGSGDLCDSDDDGDGVPDGSDNCRTTYNPSQTNADGDSQGDACDADDDNDGVVDAGDNCPLTYNPDQSDCDEDGVGDSCDNCPQTYNPSQADSDGDGTGDACESPVQCVRCPALLGDDCSELPLGSPCGKPCCGGVCRVCGGQRDCFRP